jgi:hypothetical protein
MAITFQDAIDNEEHSSLDVLILFTRSHLATLAVLGRRR